MKKLEKSHFEKQKPQNRGTKVLFKNPVLEKLSRTNSFIAITIFVLFSSGLLIWSLLKTSLLWWESSIYYLLGLLLFTLFEYVVHRIVFHMGTETKIKAKIQYTFHGVHHDFPRDKDRLAMPPIISIVLSSLIIAVFYWIIGIYAFPFLGGFFLGYAAYLFIHYSVHAYPPPKNFLKILWINHSIHHYKDNESAYGVSSPLWDIIFGTLPDKQASKDFH